MFQIWQFLSNHKRFFPVITIACANLPPLLKHKRNVLPEFLGFVVKFPNYHFATMKRCPLGYLLRIWNFLLWRHLNYNKKSWPLTLLAVFVFVRITCRRWLSITYIFVYVRYQKMIKSLIFYRKFKKGKHSTRFKLFSLPLFNKKMKKFYWVVSIVKMEGKKAWLLSVPL